VDFGVSLDAGMFMTKFTQTLSGKFMGITLAYAPPEIIQKGLFEKFKAEFAHSELKEEIKEKSLEYSREKIDVYLWGMTFYQLVSKKSLEDLCNEWDKYRVSIAKYNEFKRIVDNLKIDVDIEKGKRFIELISLCLCYSPVDRPTFNRINSYWMKDIIGKSKQENTTFKITENNDNQNVNGQKYDERMAKEYLEKGLNCTNIFEKRKYYEKAIFIYKLLNIENYNLAQAYYNLGVNCDDDKERCSCYKKSIEIRNKLGIENDNLAQAYYNLGVNCDDDKERCNYYKKSIEIRNKLGIENNNLADTYYNLGVHCDDKLEKIVYYTEALRIYKKLEQNYDADITLQKLNTMQ